MGKRKEGYSQPDFRIKNEVKSKLKDYCISKKRPISKYIESAVVNKMMRDGIIGDEGCDQYES